MPPKVEGSGQVGIPPFVEEWRGAKARYNGPNCFGAALGLFGSYVDTPEMEYYVERDWVAISQEQLKPGDIIIFDGFDHAAVYLGDDGTGPKVFHKPNWVYQSGYEIVPLDEAMWEVEKAHYWYATDKFDRIGKPVPTKESCQNVPMQFFAPKSDMFTSSSAGVSSSFDVASPMALAQLPLMQYYLLRAADLVGLETFVRPQVSFTRLLADVMTFVRDKLLTQNGIFGFEQFMAVGRELAESYLRLSSFDTQIDALQRQFDDITEKNFHWKELQVYKDGFITFDGVLRGEIALHLVMLGVPADKIAEAVVKTENAIKERYDQNVSYLRSGWSPASIPFPIIEEIRIVAKQYTAPSGEAPSVGDVLEVTPLDFMSDPLGVGGLLGGRSAPVSLKLVALPHDAMMKSLQTLTLEREPAKLVDLPRVERIVGAVERAQRMIRGKTDKP